VYALKAQGVTGWPRAPHCLLNFLFASTSSIVGRCCHLLQPTLFVVALSTWHIRACCPGLAPALFLPALSLPSHAGCCGHTATLQNCDS
jgi:hypothetical protein